MICRQDGRWKIVRNRIRKSRLDLESLESGFSYIEAESCY
jgi:hypothetical protein